MAPGEGVEPSISSSKPDVLPVTPSRIKQTSAHWDSNPEPCADLALTPLIRRLLYRLSYAPGTLVAVEGVEPTSLDYQSSALSLSYTAMVDSTGLKPAPHGLKGRRSVTRAPSQEIGGRSWNRTNVSGASNPRYSVSAIRPLKLFHEIGARGETRTHDTGFAIRRLSRLATSAKLERLWGEFIIRTWNSWQDLNPQLRRSKRRTLPIELQEQKNLEHRTGFEPVSQRWQRCVLNQTGPTMRFEAWRN